MRSVWDREVAGSNPAIPTNKNTMSKIEKKKQKLKERIEFLENEMRTELTKKTSNTKEIDVPSYQRKIQDLRKELLTLK